jgi:hypothetical protein
MGRFLAWYDRASRLDFAGTILSLIVDWKAWLLSLLPAGASAMTFLWAAIKGRDPLDVWVAAVVIFAGLFVILYVIVILSRGILNSRHSAKRKLAGHLDDLYAEGVNFRNQVIPTIQNFDWNNHHSILKEWDAKVLAILNSDHVPVSQRSSFRTLNRYDGIATKIPDKSDAQCHMESIWTEKLSRLKPIMAELEK